MLSPEALAEVRVIFGQAYNRQMYLAVGLAAACFVVALLTWPGKRDFNAPLDTTVKQPTSSAIELRRVNTIVKSVKEENRCGSADDSVFAR